MRSVFLVCVAPLLVAAVSVAELPQIENAAIESRILQGDLVPMVQEWSQSATQATWLGWQAPMAAGGGMLCCWSRGDRRWQSQACSMESSRRSFVFSSERPQFVAMSDNLVVLLKARDGELEELRAYSDGCRLDAGGRDLIWLEGVDPEASVELLTRLTESQPAVEDEALMAMALHATPAAAEELTTIARQSGDEDLRGEALFWLAHTGIEGASDIILQAMTEDPDADVREEAIFALSQLPDHEGIPLLLGIIQDRSRPSDMREEAFFWYVQEGDDQALDLIAEILTN